MKTTIQQMLAEAYELEGMLLLADNRGDDTPEYVYTAIGEKIDRLRSLAVLAKPAKDDVDDDVIGVTGLGLFEAAQTTDPDSFAGNYTHEVKLSQGDDPEQLSLMIDSESEEEEEGTVILETDEEPIIMAPDDGPVVIETPEEPAKEPEPEEAIAPKEEDTADEEEDGEVYKEDEEVEEVVEVPIVDAEPEMETEPVRLDEMLQRSKSKDLKAAFSLNDTFRFRRELFSNSGAEMTDALHLVEAMQSFDEAEDYFYGDLGWDRESDDVKDFMAIIKNHFL